MCWNAGGLSQIRQSPGSAKAELYLLDWIGIIRYFNKTEIILWCFVDRGVGIVVYSYSVRIENV